MEEVCVYVFAWWVGGWVGGCGVICNRRMMTNFPVDV